MKLTRRQIFAGWVALTTAAVFPVKIPVKTLSPHEELIRALQARIDRDMFGSSPYDGVPLKIESLEGTLRNVTYDNKHLILT